MAERADDPHRSSPVYTERDGYLEVRFAAIGSFALLLGQVRELVSYCQDRKPSHLLVDFGEIRLLLSTLERYELGRIGAELAAHVSRAAVLARPELIDPQKFGVQVANNRGLALDVFSDREAALAWLGGA